MSDQGVNRGVLTSRGRMTPGNFIRIVQDNIVEDSGLNTGGPGPVVVTSFNTRTGAVVSQNGDYGVSQVTGAAPLASPTFTGTVTLPSGLVIPAAGLTLSPSSGALAELLLPAEDQLFLLAPSPLNGNSHITMGQGTVQIAGGSGGLDLITSPTGNIQMDKVSQYNARPTAGQGLSTISDADLQTGLAANYNGGAGKLLGANHGDGSLFRISGVQQITQIATSSSTFPSLTLTYTGVAGIARTVVLVATSAANTTATLTSFVAIICANIGNIILTSAAYASSGATPMQYALAYVTEQLI
jgi:hypothetical protein